MSIGKSDPINDQTGGWRCVGLTEDRLQRGNGVRLDDL